MATINRDTLRHLTARMPREEKRSGVRIRTSEVVAEGANLTIVENTGWIEDAPLTWVFQFFDEGGVDPTNMSDPDTKVVGVQVPVVTPPLWDGVDRTLLMWNAIAAAMAAHNFPGEVGWRLVEGIDGVSGASIAHVMIWDCVDGWGAARVITREESTVEFELTETRVGQTAIDVLPVVAGSYRRMLGVERVIDPAGPFVLG